MQLASRIGLISVVKSTGWLAGGGRALICSGVKAPGLAVAASRQAAIHATKVRYIKRNRIMGWTKKHSIFIKESFPGWPGLGTWPLEGGAGEPRQFLGLCQRVHNLRASRFKMTPIMSRERVAVK